MINIVHGTGAKMTDTRIDEPSRFDRLVLEWGKENQEKAGHIQIQDKTSILLDAQDPPDSQTKKEQVERDQGGMVVQDLQRRDGAGLIIDMAVGEESDQEQGTDQACLDHIAENKVEDPEKADRSDQSE